MYVQTIMGAENDTLSIWGIDPLWHENGTVILWNEFWNTASEFYDSSTLLPLGLYVKTNITGRDPAGWSVMGWYYNGIFYESTEAFREAFFSSSFEKLGPNVDGDWAHTDQQGEIMQYDEISPPMLVLPGKPRYGIDMEEKYVEWSKSSGGTEHCSEIELTTPCSGLFFLHLLQQRHGNEAL